MADANTHWDGAAYAKNSSIQYGITMDMLAQKNFAGDERILDIGCGNGKIAYELALKVPDGLVIGVDNSTSMLDTARSTFTAQRNLSFQFKDAQELEFERRFDLVVSTFCLQWVSDKAKAFRGIRTSLKSGGKAMLIMPFRNQEIAKLRKQMASEPRWRKYFVDFIDPSDCLDDCQYEMYARQAGFTVTSCTIEKVPTEFPEKRAYTDFVSSLAPHLVRLSENTQREEFVDELVRRYLDEVPQKSGSDTVAHTYVFAKLFAQ